MRKREGFYWVLGLLAGFIIGLVAGLIYAWELNPPPIRQTTPAMLRPRDKEIYLLLIAASYSNNGNLDKAKARLAAFQEGNIENSVAQLAERYVAEDRDIGDIRSLAKLASALGEISSAILVYAATPTATPTPPPTPTKPLRLSATLIPQYKALATGTSSPAATQATSSSVGVLRFHVVQSVALCDPRTNGLLRIQVRDDQGYGLPGAEIIVSWLEGEDHFFTGLKYPADPGYADFEMEAERTYNVVLANVATIPVERSANAVVEIKADRRKQCSDLPPNISPSWQIVYEQEK